MRADAEQRALEAAAALAWGRERAQALEDRGRRLEELEWAAAEIPVLERRREAARRRLHDVNARIIRAARLEAETAERDRERVDLARFAQTPVAALDLDRFEFTRRASARGAGELIAPRLREAAPGSAAVEGDGAGGSISAGARARTRPPAGGASAAGGPPRAERAA